MLGVDAPSWHDVSGDHKRDNKRLKRLPEDDPNNWPLHVKHVSPIDIDQVAQLPCVHDDTQVFFKRAARWLKDPQLYSSETLGAPNIRRTLYTTAQIREMIDIKIRRYSEADEGPPLAGLLGFPRAEHFKRRLRPLFAPDTNRSLDAATLQKLRYKSRADVRDDIHAGPYCVQLDMRSYYDQFTLADEVARAFVFRHGKELYCLRTLAMGQRQACEVAQGTTWVLVDFARPPTVRVTTCIDNIRFVGPRDDVIAAVKTFLTRCRRVGAQLNEVPDGVDIDSFDVDTIAETSGVFLGEMYDYDKKTVAVSPKTHQKLELCRNRLRDAATTPLSVRQIATHIALLFYTAPTLGINLAKYFNALRYYRALSTLLAADPQMWNSQSIPQMPTTVANEFAEWTDLTLQNTPLRVPTPQERATQSTLTIITDASAWGCAAIAIDSENGTCQTLRQQWHPEEAGMMEASSVAEPEAIWRAACRFTRQTDKRVTVLTDHTGVIAPSQRGYAKSWFYNLLLLRLRATYPHTCFEMKHVAGTVNTAHAASRGGDWTTELVQGAIEIAEQREKSTNNNMENHTGEAGNAHGAEEREGEASAHNYNKNARPLFMV